MMANDTELWYGIRDGEYFCKKDDRLLTARTVMEAFVPDTPSVVTCYSCESCGRIVILPSPMTPLPTNAGAGRDLHEKATALPLH